MTYRVFKLFKIVILYSLNIKKILPISVHVNIQFL